MAVAPNVRLAKVGDVIVHIAIGSHSIVDLFCHNKLIEINDSKTKTVPRPDTDLGDVLDVEIWACDVIVRNGLMARTNKTTVFWCRFKVPLTVNCLKAPTH